MRNATCIDCRQTFDVPSRRGPLPKRCGPCRRSYLAALQREWHAAQSASAPDREVRCRDCGSPLAWSGRGRPASRCAGCLAAWNRAENKRRGDAWRAANSDHVRARDRRNYQRNADSIRARKREAHYRLKYGITRDERDRMLAEQGGRCLICGTDQWGKRGPCVDHCHNTTRVRGLLCSNCNTLIGLANEDPAVLLAAIEYLRGK